MSVEMWALPSNQRPLQHLFLEVLEVLEARIT